MTLKKLYIQVQSNFLEQTLQLSFSQVTLNLALSFSNPLWQNSLKQDQRIFLLQARYCQKSVGIKQTLLLEQISS